MSDNYRSAKSRDCPDAVLVQVRVESIAAGDFALRGSLREDNRDATVTAVAEFTRSEAGSALVTLAFSPRELPPGIALGPFVLSELTLTRQGEDPQWLDATAPAFPVSVTLYNPVSRYLRLAGNLDYGTIRIGESAMRTLVIHNDGREPLSIAGLSLPPGFHGIYEGRVDPGIPVEVEIQFDANQESVVMAELDVDSDAYSGETRHPLRVTVWPEARAFADWLADAGVLPEHSGPLDDPNGDGVSNLLSYLFNLPPGVGGNAGVDRSNALPAPSIGEDANGRYLSLRYRHHREAERLSVGLETCDDLAANSWQPIQPDSVVDVGIDSTTGDPIREMRVRIVNEPRKFVRMVVREIGFP